ncbi:MAG TPA: hypothetical protein PLU22_04670 [Polyangiaceae bacterium]|nr:hypothetical protein [Polyangiaceae bacterium]
MVRLAGFEKGLLALTVLAALLACKNPLGGGKEEKAEASSAGGGDKIGVPECDEYIEKYEKCLTTSTKIPDAAKQSMKGSFDQMRTSWKQAAATPAGKAGLGMGCKQAMESTKQAMAAYGCEW